MRSVVARVFLVPALLSATWSPVRAQVFPGTDPPSSTDSLPRSSAPYSDAVALLEKTIFRIDVAVLRVRFGPETTSELASLLTGREPSPALADSAAAAAIRTGNAWVTLTFLRNVGFGRFMGGIRDGVVTARNAGVVDRPFAAALLDSMPVWYAPVETRGVREGDVMSYRIRGDTLRTVFRTNEGMVLLDQMDVGPQAPLTVLGGFFSRGSDFRKRLLASLLSGGGR